MKKLMICALAATMAGIASADILVVSEDVSTLGQGSSGDSQAGNTFQGGLFTGRTIVDFEENPARFWLKFVLPSLSPGTFISAATLHGYYINDWDSGVNTLHNIALGSDAWSEGTLTRDTEPGFAGSLATFDAAAQSTGNWVSFDVTGAVNDAYQTDSTVSFVMHAVDESIDNQWEYFASKEFEANKAFYIEYRVQAVPEPATMTALALGTLAMLRRRRK